MLIRFNEAVNAKATKLVWPNGPTRETFDGETYCHTGIFDGPRKRDNVKSVTSVFVDVDFVDLARVAYPHETDKKLLKVALRGALSEHCDHYDLMTAATDALGEAIKEANLPEPTLILCSGWGLHIHWALSAAEGERVAKEISNNKTYGSKVFETINARVSPRFVDILHRKIGKDEWPDFIQGMLSASALQRWGAQGIVDKQVSDLGTRLCRYPGDVNKKDPSNHIPVEIHLASQNVLYKLTDLAQAKAPEVTSAEAPASRLKALAQDYMRSALTGGRSPGKPKVAHNFADVVVQAGNYEGKTLRQIGDEELPDLSDATTKVKIASPFAPKPDERSDGSAFLVRDSEGFLMVFCAITDKVYIDSVDPSLPIEEASASDGDPWGNSLGTANLHRDLKTQVPVVSMTNVLNLLNEDATFSSLFFDDFSNRFFMDRQTPDGSTYLQPIETDALMRLTIKTANDLYRHWNLSAAERIIKHALKEFAAQNPDSHTGREYHRDWLQDYMLDFHGKWDKTPRLDTWLIDVTGCADTALNRLYGRKWMLQLAATGLKLGTAQAVLLLRGKQGGGKSSFGQILRWGKRRTALSVEERALPAGYTDQVADPTGNKRDVASSFASAWIIEDAEALLLSNKNTAAVKALLTSDTVEARVMYSEDMRTVPLRCCIYASTNEQAVLSDRTGARRIYGVEVADRMNIQLLAEIREQLFAEAVEYLMSDAAQDDLNAGRSPWVIQADEEIEVEGVRVNVYEAQASENRSFSEDNDWDGIVELVRLFSAGGKANSFSVAELLTAYDPDIKIPDIKKSVRNAIAASLRRFGFDQVRRNSSSTMEWYLPEQYVNIANKARRGNGLHGINAAPAEKKAAREKVMYDAAALVGAK